MDLKPLDAFDGNPSRRTFEELLLLVFALAGLFEDREPGVLGVRNRERFQFHGGTKAGDHFTNGLLASGAFLQRWRTQRTVQRELPTAHHAIALAKLIFVNRHGRNIWETAVNVKRRVLGSRPRVQ